MELKQNLINDFKKINSELRKKFMSIEKIDKNKVKKILDIKTMKNLNENELKNICKKGDIVGVDGSKNKIGNLYPHYLIAIQAMAKPMNLDKKEVVDSVVYSPLIDDLDLKESEEKEKNIMAELEVKSAIKSIYEHRPYILMMDGSLMSYKIRCSNEWEILKKAALKNNIILIGVIEEIKTKELATFLIEKKIDIKDDIYDKEIMFGILEEGEYIQIQPSKSNKNMEKIGTCFLRTSTDPNVIGIDFLDEQITYLEEICDIVYTLTPRDSRGIPIWLDIVDKEVKISDEMIKALIETYIDEDLAKLFLKAKRENRTL